jgi:hypothetical protein
VTAQALDEATAEQEVFDLLYAQPWITHVRVNAIEKEK